MKITCKIYAISLAFLFLLSACTANENKQTGFAKIDATTDTQLVTDDEGQESIPSDTVPMWEHRLENGKLIYSITNAQVITNASQIGEGSFGEYNQVAIFNGSYYKQALDNYSKFGNLWETTYTYPDFIDEHGDFLYGIRMIMLDVTVQSDNATNQWTNSRTGEVETRYGNPYLFKVDSLLYLIDTAVVNDDGTYSGKAIGFFSDYGKYAEHPLAYELKPGETKCFRIGYLVGNRPDGSNTDLKDLVVGTSFSSLDQPWFGLNLEESE